MSARNHSTVAKSPLKIAFRYRIKQLRFQRHF